MLNLLWNLLRGNHANALGNNAALDLKSLVTVKNSASTESIAPRFAAHYAQYIQPQVEEFEAARVAALETFRSRLMIALPLAIIVIGGGAYLINQFQPTSSLIETLATLAMIVAGIAGSWVYWPVLKYKDSIKTRIFADTFRYFGPEWQYRPNGIGGQVNSVNTPSAGLGGLFQESQAEEQDYDSYLGMSAMTPYMHFGILPTHERAKTEDYLSGAHREVPLSLFECTLTSTRNSGKRRHTVVHFKGLVVQLHVPKRFGGHTTVKRDAGSVGNWFGKQFSGELKPVKLEDPRFEKRYEVYGSDQVEARYLLSPSFMERLVELEDLFAAHNGGRCDIKCAFKDGKLLFAIPTTKEWFSTGSIFKPANFIGEINLILKEMDQLFAIIDILKLDDRTGL